ncbi:hypothetical protein [Bacillus sp. UNC322MFChir4.1]|uniref:hypothetical protein n=1 Tax=Bacillus sp. UNC322MFChir4.1 TaxID=1449045 RepID=UPI00054F1CF4|nr:hypothetical protein [Bacillus sp. UNC322MFChir4.1]
MSLFAKNKPTKRVDFEGGWVELQFLSKGAKDHISSQLSNMFADMDSEAIKKMKLQNKDDIPAEMIGVIGKVQQVEYYKLSQAIRSWSEQEEITIETVKELNDEIFDLISKEINKMNELNLTERKN